MIKIEIEIEEKGTNFIKNKKSIKTDLEATITILEEDATKGEHEVLEEYKKRLNINRKCEILDHTKDKKFTDLVEKINELIKGIE